MMREITDHKVGGLNEKLDVHAMDLPGQGGASHDYRISHPVEGVLLDVKFQKGPIAEFGVNGVSNEALLAIVADRLVGFQSGEYACADNEIALEAVREALAQCQARTKARLARGVEGTSTV